MKNKTSNLLFILPVVCLVLVAAEGQTRRRRPASPAPAAKDATPSPESVKKRPVIISLKSGATVNGDFIQASGNSVRVEVEGMTRIIYLDDVTTIAFNDEDSADSGTTAQRQAGLTPQAKTAVGDAIKALRTMAGASRWGTPFQEYGSRVMDAKADVDEALRQLPDGDLKTEISLAMEAYADADTAWNEMLRYDFMLMESEPAPTLQKKYTISVETMGGRRVISRDRTLSTIWQAARTHIEKADSLLN